MHKPAVESAVLGYQCCLIHVDNILPFPSFCSGAQSCWDVSTVISACQCCFSLIWFCIGARSCQQNNCMILTVVCPSSSFPGTVPWVFLPPFFLCRCTRLPTKQLCDFDSTFCPLFKFSWHRFVLCRCTRLPTKQLREFDRNALAPFVNHRHHHHHHPRRIYVLPFLSLQVHEAANKTTAWFWQ